MHEAFRTFTTASGASAAELATIQTELEARYPGHARTDKITIGGNNESPATEQP